MNWTTKRSDEPILVPMEEESLEEILGVEREAFDTPWQKAHFLYELRDNPFARCYVLRRVAGPILGYACTWELRGELIINNIAIRKDCRGRGMGRGLLAQILKKGKGNGCRIARLDVRPSNRPAVELYYQTGFRVTGTRRGYYKGGREDGWVMTLPLR